LTIAATIADNDWNARLVHHSRVPRHSPQGDGGAPLSSTDLGLRVVTNDEKTHWLNILNDLFGFVTDAGDGV
jgi:hypothetical protein